MTPVRVAPLVLLPLWYSALAGQNGAARPAVAVINLRFNGEHANVLQPGDTAVVAAATSKLRATLGASDVGTIVGSGATATAVAQAEADGNPCDNACALAVAPRIGARWVAKGTISNLSNIGRLLFVALLTGPRAVSERGAAVTVIDVDSLRREFPVRSLSELLTGRVPGLVVLASSGTIGTASRLVIRGASSVRGSEAPQVYVDGIRVDDEPSTLTVSVGGQTTSRVDDVNVEDIATIAILRGPAAAALYARDATAGVLLVTTKRAQGGCPAPGAGEPQLRRPSQPPWQRPAAGGTEGRRHPGPGLLLRRSAAPAERHEFRRRPAERPAGQRRHDRRARLGGLPAGGHVPDSQHATRATGDRKRRRELAAAEIPDAACGRRPRSRESA